MIKLIQDNKINGKQAKLVIEEIYKNNENIDSIIKKLNLIQITDENSIRDILSNIIKNNPDIVSQYKERPERVEKFIFGLLMKETKGQANPIVAKNILINLLK
jgi:aspartyl-tRNA(Asn)/glutamyl-tRNA(Gln) amidotransferase subunit B